MLVNDLKELMEKRDFEEMAETANTITEFRVGELMDADGHQVSWPQTNDYDLIIDGKEVEVKGEFMCFYCYNDKFPNGTGNVCLEFQDYSHPWSGPSPRHKPDEFIFVICKAAKNSEIFIEYFVTLNYETWAKLIEEKEHRYRIDKHYHRVDFVLVPLSELPVEIIHKRLEEVYCEICGNAVSVKNIYTASSGLCDDCIATLTKQEIHDQTCPIEDGRCHFIPDEKKPEHGPYFINGLGDLL